MTDNSQPSETQPQTPNIPQSPPKDLSDRNGTLARPPKSHLWLTGTLVVVFAALLGTGLLQWFVWGSAAADEGLVWLGKGHAFWASVHRWLGLGLVVLILWHLWVHRQALTQATNRHRISRKSAPAWLLLGALAALLLLPLIVRADYGSDGYGEPEPPPRERWHRPGPHRQGPEPMDALAQRQRPGPRADRPRRGQRMAWRRGPGWRRGRDQGRNQAFGPANRQRSGVGQGLRGRHGGRRRPGPGAGPGRHGPGPQHGWGHRPRGGWRHGPSGSGWDRGPAADRQSRRPPGRWENPLDWDDPDPLMDLNPQGDPLQLDNTDKDDAATP